MALPLIALFAAGILGKRAIGQRSAAASQSAFNSALTGFTHDPNGVGPPIPGSQTGQTINPEQAAGLQKLYRANPQAGSQLLGQLLGQNHRASQAQIGRDLQQSNLDLARETLDFNRLKFDQAVTQAERAADPEHQRSLAEAKDTGQFFIDDPLTGVRTAQPAPGTKEWQERTEGAQSVADGLDVWNQLMSHTAQNGVIRDPGAPGFGVQQSLRTRLVGSLKESLKLGALDEGVLNFASGLIPAQDVLAKDFAFGNDATAIERLTKTGELFQNSYRTQAENTRLLPGVNPEITTRFDAIGTQAQQLNQLIPPLLQQVQAGGGDIVPAGQTVREQMLQQARENPRGAGLGTLRQIGVDAVGSLGIVGDILFGGERPADSGGGGGF